MNKIIKKLLILPFLIPFTLFASTTKPQTQADSLPESTTSALIQLESAMKENLDLINNDSEVYKPSIDDRLNDIYNAMVDNIINSASNFIGTPYRRGAKGPKSFDCSGFTSYIFAREGDRKSVV